VLLNLSLGRHFYYSLLPMRWFLSLFLSLVCGMAYAHDPGLSTATLRLDTNRLEAVLVFSVVDTKEIVDLDKNQDGKLSQDELDQGAAELQTMAPTALDVKFDGQLVKPAEFRCHFDQSDNATVYLSFPLESFSNLVVRSKWLAMLPPGHKQFLSLQNPDGQALAERLLSANSDSITVQMDAETKAPPPAEKTSFAGFLAMGVKHIWTGYDHLLFLFGLLIVTKNFKSSVTIITCFTIAHSISLAAATLNIVPVSAHFSTRVVEPLIAASIVYVGIENLMRGNDPKGRWLLTFGFGLIHGLGCASALK